jgi:hypothetical protein
MNLIAILAKIFETKIRRRNRVMNLNEVFSSALKVIGIIYTAAPIVARNRSTSNGCRKYLFMKNL